MSQVTSNETEVYRISPIAGKYYETAEYTRHEGRWPDKLFYTTNKMRYVGKFIKHIQYGYGDGATHIDIFELNGEEIKIYYSYYCTTCFREVEGRESCLQICLPEMKKMENNKENNIKSLATLSKYALPTMDIEIARQYEDISGSIVTCSNVCNPMICRQT